MYSIKRFAVFLAAALLVMIVAAGCDKEENTDRSELTTSFLEDTVFTVSDERVGLTEWYLYALPQIAQTESLYGKEIWDYKINDDSVSMWDSVKDDIMGQIVYIKIVCARAESLGISLSEDDLLTINLQTDEYMSRLSTAQKEEYGITEDIVKKIYRDNMLAMKVYENLTLNIDTDIPDEEVRHMVLEYIPILKDHELDNGEIVDYTPEELALIKADAEQYLAAARADTNITHLAEINDDRYSVVEMVADFEELSNKLPGDIPRIAFSMNEGEIAGLFETDDAFFILDCVRRTDEESTNEARIAIIESRQKALFEEQYSIWEKETVIKTNYKVWDSLER